MGRRVLNRWIQKWKDFCLRINIPKNLRGWVGFRESYVIFKVGHGKSLRPITRWVGGVKKAKKHA